ncbi:phage head completion protein [Clostridium butyricum]|uniref:Putative phage head-tail adaptor n=1 Tax=Clostridium butyricum E4 str. BoNT E BL5262 TaxID=632245 RepID=C4IGR9_CLOBU|nr:head-tail adaptor protein [Clostridium butyricum]EDT74837.1 putative phage head-tail adaptor [Clostridium butyricum 5521]EEP54724.1 putative phage head-tail adaptor [Clostridium butyricum E4 str. BoNT E BL5262]NFL30487.1 head-tail adaptor protein [Clostridium butyricum]NFS19442.1 head-tail adaptor protein [Clostridium butyricum]
MPNLTNKLKNKIDVYGKTLLENTLKEKYYGFGKIKSVWCNIAPQSGMIKTLEGNYEYAEMSYKIIVRNNSIPKLDNTMYFIYKNQKYSIKYFQPDFKNKNRIEIFCKLVME